MQTVHFGDLGEREIGNSALKRATLRRTVNTIGNNGKKNSPIFVERLGLVPLQNASISLSKDWGLVAGMVRGGGRGLGGRGDGREGQGQRENLKETVSDTGL